METRTNSAKPKIHRTVWFLGTVSFLNDFSSEMIYPLLPVFLKSVLGAGAVVIGVIEGLAEFVASILKIASGIWADRMPLRKPLVVIGYGISGFLRALIGIATTWWMVLIFRVGDRVGKGLRTSPRDALVADVTDANSRGAAFGVHRAMDHAGAVVGPLVAAGLIALGLNLRSIFLFSIIPAVLVLIILIFAVKEKPRVVEAPQKVAILGNWSGLGGKFHRVLFAVCIFTLGNSTDAFIILRLSDVGLKPEWIALLWSFHHMVKVGASTVGGWLSDKVGRRPMVISGWIYYAAIYLAFGLINTDVWMVVIFMLYGVYFGLTEPTEKAWVADLAPSKMKAEAYGWYNGAIGLTTLPASVLFGVLWSLWGPVVAFSAGSALALTAGLVLMTVQSGTKNSDAFQEQLP